MGLINFILELINLILDLAGLLLWLNWRASRADPLRKTSAAALVGTLRRADPSRLPRWKYPAGLAVLLLFRAVIYWQIGPAVDWIPTLRLSAITLPFRSELFGRMFLFSILSFGFTLALFFLSILLLSLVNRSTTDDEPLQKLVRLQLGRIERWPFALKLALPLAATVLLWLALNPLLARLGIIPPSPGFVRVVLQGLVIGVGTYLAWKYLVVAVLLLYLLNSYVYLGKHPLWNFVNLTSRHLLAPLRQLPLSIGRMDLSPLVGIALVSLFTELAGRWLPRIYSLIYSL